MELTFQIAACIVLCFAFVARTVLILITHQCFGCCWAVFPNNPHYHQKPVRWSWARIWEGTEAGQLPPTDQRDILYHVMLCSARKGREKEEEGVIFVVIVLVLGSSCCMCWGLVSQGVDGHLPDDGEEWINSYFCFVSMYSFCFSS